jgi:3-hydroxyacyl-[acyl-carrier-protein] dehydratase
MLLEYFQMVDRITRLDVGARIVEADCAVPDESPVFEGHFPGHPILPGVLMIETMAQTGGWLAMAAVRFGRMAFLAQVREAKMRAFVSPGAVLRATAELLHEGSGYAVMSARLFSGGALAAEAELRYRVTDFPNATLHAAMLTGARRVGVPEHLLIPAAQDA